MSESGSKKNKTKSQPVANAKTVFMRLLRYVLHYKFLLFAAVFFTAILSLSNTAFLALIKEVTDHGFKQQSASQRHTLPLMLFGLMFLRAASGFISTYSIRLVARRVVETMRKQAFQRFMQMPVRYFDAQSTGVLISKITYDAERVSIVCTRTAMNVLRDIMTAIGLLGYMLYLDWKLTLIFAIVTPLMGFYLSKTTPKLRATTKKVQAIVGEMTKSAEEAIAGQRIVKIFGAQAYENERFGEIVKRNRELELRFARIGGLNSFVIEALAALALGLVVYYALGQFTVGSFAAFVGALLMLISPIKHIAAANEDFQIGFSAAQSVFEILDDPIESNEGEKTLSKAKGEIEFKHVSVRYEKAKDFALDDINLSIQPGEKIALVGRSGGGKTTLVNLLPRFYDLQQGTILLDGIDIRALDLANLRAQFALVSQDIVLFNDTVFNNIAYGTLRNATEAEVIAAAKAAHAWEFIQAMPQGLHSEIGDRGVRLSGGQRQRIAIARAILKNAPILLLDEATSALDSESEDYVQAALDTLMQGGTSIVIAHRLSTVENADRIVVMDKGKIVEVGTHANLIAAGGYYARLYQKEFELA